MVIYYQYIIIIINEDVSKYFWAHSRLYKDSFLKRFIWHIHGTLTDTTTPGKSEHGSNSNEQVLYSEKKSESSSTDIF